MIPNMENGMPGMNVESQRIAETSMVIGPEVELFVLVMMMCTLIQRLLSVLQDSLVVTVQFVKMTIGKMPVVIVLVGFGFESGLEQFRVGNLKFLVLHFSL